ncbi:MAG TPA: hypothetical protein VGH37_15345 [Candidatus Acidoferrum sp.]|jgi:hypothetical protein
MNRTLKLLGMLWLFTLPLGFTTRIGAQEQSNQANTSEQKAAKPVEEGTVADENTTEALQKATQNPVASLISVPVQNNSNFGMNPGYRTQDVLNIQPVIPIGISKDWNLIVRVITPIIWQPLPNAPSTPETGVYGLGDMVPTFFLSPKKPGKIIWGVGPVFQLPTATSNFLGQGKLGIGPSVVALAQPGHWTLGALVNNIWSVAGSGSRPAVNQFTLQYFINYNLKKGWYITWQPTLTANWEAPSGNQWTVPYGGGVGRIMKLGFQPVSLTAQFFGNAVHPAGTPAWTMRLQIAFLFPKLTEEQKKMMLEKKLKQMDQAPAPPKS